MQVDTCNVISATPEDPLQLRRRCDAARLVQLLQLLDHTDELQVTSRVQDGDEKRLVVRPTISEIFANQGLVELITKLL